MMMKWLWITFIVFISDTQSIQTRIQRPVRFVDQKTFPTRHFRHVEAGPSVHLDWEHGLREATVQALLRERIGDHNLRKHIYSAPLLGKQDKATPFGDIAILARGQLYANYAGFIFVQDPYQNDCDDCHNVDAEPVRGRCINNQCQIWHSRNNDQLIALWSIKRIRHRTLKDAYSRLELEFSIAPVDLRHHGYLTKEGAFNYNLPGHVFVLKSPDTHQNLHTVQNVNHFKHGAFIAQTPNGKKIILHGFPGGILTPEAPRYQPPKDLLPTATTTTQYSEEDPKKVYQTLLEVLHKKTSVDPNRFVPSTSTISDTTLVRFPDGQLVPITELHTPFITKTTPGYVTVRFPETSSSELPKQPKEHATTSSHPFLKPLTPQSAVPAVEPQTYGSTSTTKQTTPQDFYTTQQQQQTAFTAPPTTYGYSPQTPSDFFNKPRPVYPTRPQHRPPATTKPPPVKMTFHFFAAEEEKPVTTPEVFKKPPTVRPTEPTKIFPTEYNIKTTYSEATTRQPFTTISSSARPATLKPIIPESTTYFSNEIPSTHHTATEASTKIVPSTIYEPPTTTYLTSKKPFAIPITVLEENYYPSTGFNEAFTITQEPTTATDGSRTKYTNTQFYNPTTTEIATPQEEFTTSVLRGTTLLESREPTRDSTIDTTYYYAKTPTIETTLGQTTLMGVSQNKTTEMVYYAAEETEGSSIPSTTLGRESIVPTTRGTEITGPTNTLSESTPKRIVTTIAADGTVSVKTTPFNAEDELFGLTKSYTKKPKTTKSYKVSTTQASDFLVEDSSQQDYQRPLFQRPLKDYSEDEIFGATKGVYTKTTPKTRKYTKSDIEQALFDSGNSRSRKSKALLRRKSSTTESTPPKVLYSNFFEASTLPMSTQSQVTTSPSVEIVTPSSVTVKESYEESRRHANISQEEDKTMPVTSQSYLTSISYEINRRKKPFNKELLENIKKDTKDKSETNTTVGIIDDYKKFHNDFAWRLVGQAKGVAYLDDATTTSVSTIASTSARTTKKPKYARRRSYVARAKRPKRRKTEDSEHNNR